MATGEIPSTGEKEPKVGYIDFLKAQQQGVIEAQQKARDAQAKAVRLGEEFQANLRKLNGKTVTISGQLTGEEAMIQDGFEMHSSYRTVSDLTGTIESVWANDRIEEGYNRNKPRVYIRQFAEKGYRPHEVMANLFELRSVEINDEPEVPTPEAPTAASIALENTVAKP